MSGTSIVGRDWPRRFLIATPLVVGVGSVLGALTLLVGPLALLAPPAGAFLAWTLLLPFRGLQLATAFLPPVPFDVSGAVYSAIELGWLSGLAALLLAVVVSASRDVRSVVRASPALLLFLGVIASRGLSLWLGPDLPMDQARLDFVARFFWASTLDASLLFFGSVAIERAEQIRQWFWLVAVSGLVHAVPVFFTGYQPETRVDLAPRHAGFFAGSMEAAGFLLFYLVATVTLIGVERRWSRRLLLGPLAAVFLGAQYYTQAKTALVALLVSYALLLFLRQSLGQMLRYLLVSLLVVLLILPFLPDQVTTLFRVIFYSLLDPNTKVFEEQKIGSVAGRIIVALFGLSLFLEYPLTGVGWGRHGILLEPLTSVDMPFNVIHTYYITVLAETGAIGFTIFLATIVVTIWNLVSAMKTFSVSRARENVSLCRGLLVAYCGGLIIYIALFDVFGRVFWLIGGLSFAVRRVASAGPRPSSSWTSARG